MPRAILEAWLSPARQECYYHNVIHLDTSADIIGECPVAELADYHYPGCVFELFTEEEQKGLWKVVLEVDWRGTYCAHTGEHDIDYDITVLLKSKCRSFSELKTMWEYFLNPKED